MAKRKNPSSPPRSPEAEEAFRLAQALAHGEIHASDIKPDPALINDLAHEAALSDKRMNSTPKVRPVRTPRKISAQLLRDAAGHAKSNESRIPDMFE